VLLWILDGVRLAPAITLLCPPVESHLQSERMTQNSFTNKTKIREHSGKEKTL
jgi:hypothetical protein